jgi:hypothetical protein
LNSGYSLKGVGITRFYREKAAVTGPKMGLEGLRKAHKERKAGKRSGKRLRID